jgi:transposase
MLVERLGRPLRFLLTPGQVHDIVVAPLLLEGRKARAVIADTAYDSNALREVIRTIGAEAVIPSHPKRTHPFPLNKRLYKTRNRIERCFNKLKHFRRLATRFDRRAIHFLALLHLAGAMLWMR